MIESEIAKSDRFRYCGGAESLVAVDDGGSRGLSLTIALICLDTLLSLTCLFVPFRLGYGDPSQSPRLVCFA